MIIILKTLNTFIINIILIVLIILNSQVLERGGCVLAGADERPLKVFSNIFQVEVEIELEIV